MSKRFQTERFKIAFEDKTTVVMESKSVLPRAFMVYDWEIIKTREKTLDKLLDSEFPISEKIILTKRPSFETSVRPENTVKLHTYYEQGIGAKITTDKSGMLFISDAFYPGWKAYVDNKEVEIFQANFAFRAVEIPEGDHEVKMVYEPKSFDNGVKLSLISLALLLAIYPAKKLYLKRE